MVSKNVENNIRRTQEMMNTGDFSDFHEVMTDNVTYRTTLSTKVQGLEGFKKIRSAYADAFENFKLEPQYIYGEGNTAVVVYKQSGTHVGEFLGIEPSNNRWEQLACAIVTVDDDGKVVDIFDLFDQLETLYQLDALPEQLKEVAEGMTRQPGA